jgi:hypothetical protein
VRAVDHIRADNDAFDSFDLMLRLGDLVRVGLAGAGKLQNYDRDQFYDGVSPISRALAGALSVRSASLQFAQEQRGARKPSQTLDYSR